MRKYFAGRVLMMAVLSLTVAAIASLAVMSLWNGLLPAIFAVHPITYWQALGLLVLSRLLFGGFRMGGGHRQQWRRRMSERLEKMTPEEREKLRRGMRCRPGAEAQA